MSETRPQQNMPPGLAGGGGVRANLMMPVEKPKNFKKTLFRLFRYITPFYKLLIVVLAAALFATLFSIYTPRILGEATTILFTRLMNARAGTPNSPADFIRIREILLLLAGLYVFSSMFRYLEEYVMAVVSQKIVFNMRSDFSRKLSRLPLKYFDSRPFGDILSRATNDMDTIGTTLQQSLTQLITSVVTILGILVMMLLISGWMTLITLVTLPLSFWVTAKIARKSQKNFSAQQKELGILSGHVEEMFGGHLIVKAFGHEDEATEQFRKINARLYDAGWRAQFVSGTIMPLIGFINNMGYVLISVFGCILVTRGGITIGNVQAFILYSRQFTQPVVQTANIANIIQSTIAAAERVFEVLDEEEEIPDSSAAKSVAQLAGAVRFDRVKFGYGEDKVLMKDLNINIKAGQTAAIVGPTGAGKTTLVNLLMRFYEVNGGKISIDGLNIREMKRSDLRGLFGMVLQDTWLFKGSIRDNIAYGRQDATDEEIVRAAKAAHADHFIRTLPQGYDTVLNEEASNISQGQKQLLTIARAILADPAILILDEATSSVDTRTELLIQKAMSELMRGRTSFVIAHRLSTIHDADIILVMHDGDVVEKGTNEQLLAKKGVYADLYYSQFSAEQAYPEVG